MKKTSSMTVILILSLATLLGCMNITIFNVALPVLMVYFNTDVTTIQWLTSGYTLAAGVITPAVGFLGDKFGYKRVLNSIALIIIALSVVGMLAWCVEVLIVVRIIFGMTAGMLSPLSMAMLYRTVERSEQAKAAGIWGTANVVGGAAPSVLSGIIVTYATWHVLFLMMIPMALLLLVCSIKFLPQDRALGQTAVGIDKLGFALTSMGSFALLFAFSNLSSWGLSAQFIVISVIGFLGMGIYIAKSWNKEQVLLNLSVLKYPRYVAALFADTLNIVGLYMITFVLPLFFQNGLGYSAALTGTILLPVSLVTIMAMPLATRTLTVYGEKVMSITGVVFLLLGSSVFLKINPNMTIVVILIAMCVRSFGMAFLNLMATNTSMAAVPQELVGHASALRAWIHQLGSALIVSVASTVFSLRLMRSGAQTAEEIAASYISSTELLFTVSCAALLCIIPVALKYFRGKNEMN